MFQKRQALSDKSLRASHGWAQCGLILGYDGDYKIDWYLQYNRSQPVMAPAVKAALVRMIFPSLRCGRLLRLAV